MENGKWKMAMLLRKKIVQNAFAGAHSPMRVKEITKESRKKKQKRIKKKPGLAWLIYRTL